MEFTIENRQIKPAVYPIFQNENDTTVLKFTLANYIHDDTVDLRNYTAYAVTSQNGHIDMTELESEYDAETDTLSVSWNVQEYSLRSPGAVQYQIVFKENTDDGENTAVFYSYKAILLNRMSINADDHITANYPTLLKQWLDRINQMTGGADKGFFYIPYGTVIQPSERLDGTLYWQWDNADNTAGHFEDDNGNVLTFSQYKEKTKYLPNQDLLGEMTNSESADQHYITAGSAIKNAPIATSYCLVKQYDTESTDRFIQEVQVPDGNNVVRTFVRCVSGHKDYGTEKVGEWRELVTDVDLTNKINDVNDEITDINTKIKTLAPKASPAFTGTPTAPTPAATSNTTHIATTAWVRANSGVADWANATRTDVGSATAAAKSHTVPSNGTYVVQALCKQHTNDQWAVYIGSKQVFNLLVCGGTASFITPVSVTTPAMTLKKGQVITLRSVSGSYNSNSKIESFTVIRA